MIPTSIPCAQRLAFLALIVVGGGLVVAQSTAVAAPDRSKSARTHLDTGTAYFNLEKYKEAIGEFEQAYLDKQDPAVFFHIGECHRLLGNRAEAIRFLRRFLQETQNHPSRVRAEDHLADLESSSVLPPFALPVATTPAPSGAVSPAPPGAAGAPPSVGATAPVAGFGPPTSPPQASAPASPSAAASFAPFPTNSSAPGSTTTVAAVAAPPATTPEARPLYKKWWFWTLVGAVVVGGVVTGVAVTSAPMRPGCPSGLVCQ